MRKNQNPIYDTLIGGFSGQSINPLTFLPDGISWEYTFLYGMCRFSKKWAYKINNGTNFCLTINTHRNFKLGLFRNFHFAFIKHFPFVILGFDNMKKYIINEN